MLFQHLLDIKGDDFVELADASPTQVLAGQAGTASLLQKLGVEDTTLSEDEARAARQAFVAATTPNMDPRAQKQAILLARTPPAVRHLAGMLSEYDWQFVEQATEIRGYVVAKLMEESQHPDPKIRMKALKLLGDVTEVGLFTERIEVTKKDASIEAVTDRLREKLEKLAHAIPGHRMDALQPVEDISPKDTVENDGSSAGPDA